MALTVFRHIQIGKESTYGTAVAADKLIGGSLTASPSLVYHRPIEDNNSLAEFRRSILVGQRGTLRWEGDLTYDRLADFLSMSVKGGLTPGAPAGARKVWTFAPVLTASAAQNSFTIEFGDDTQNWEAPGCVISNFEITAAIDEVVRGRIDFLSLFPEKSSKTTSITDYPEDEVVANKGKVWIDSAWSGLGGTIKSATVAGVTVRIPTGLVLAKYFDGTLAPTAVVEQKRHYEVELDLVMSSNAIIEYDAWAADTARAIRVAFTGNVIEGSNPFLFQLDFFGKYTSEPELLDERDGENMFRLTLSTFNDGSGNEFSAVVHNKEASI